MIDNQMLSEKPCSQSLFMDRSNELVQSYASFLFTVAASVGWVTLTTGLVPNGSVQCGLVKVRTANKVEIARLLMT